MLRDSSVPLVQNTSSSYLWRRDSSSHLHPQPNLRDILQHQGGRAEGERNNKVSLSRSESSSLYKKLRAVVRPDVSLLS